MIFQPSDAEIKSFNEQRNNKAKQAVISTITSDDIFKRFSQDKLCILSSTGSITTITNFNNIQESTSTWNEVNVEDFDICTGLVVKKSFKIKAKIKSISNYMPSISLT